MNRRDFFTGVIDSLVSMPIIGAVLSVPWIAKYVKKSKVNEAKIVPWIQHDGISHPIGPIEPGCFSYTITTNTTTGNIVTYYVFPNQVRNG